MKINLIYKADPAKTASWSLETGLLKAFEKIGAINYAVDVMNIESWIDVDELLKYPIFMVYPYVNIFRSIVPFLRRVPKAMLETEAFCNIDKTSYLYKNAMEKTQKEFDIVYTLCEEDSEDYFGRKVSHDIGFIDTEMFDDDYPCINDRILLLGSTYSQFRKSLVKNSIVHNPNLLNVGNLKNNTINFVREICKYKYYVSTESMSKTFSGKPFQGMACNRMVFIQRSDTYKKAMEIFQDKVHCVYFDTMKELIEFWLYYQVHREEYDRIRNAGYELVRSQFDVSNFAQKVVNDLERIVEHGKNKEMYNRLCVAAS